MILLQTVYIDVYFLINFTVDILAVYIALKLSKMQMVPIRLILSGVLGATLATVELFLANNAIIHILLCAVFLFLLSLIACRRASIFRRIKFLLLFFVGSFIISGIVNLVYNALDKYAKDFFEGLDKGNENRKILIFSLIILIVIGVFRILLILFSNSISEKSMHLHIEVENKCADVDALVDSGNLVKDPMNMCSVVFLNRTVASQLFPREVLELSDLDKLEMSFKKRVRLIPVTRNGETHIMTGVRVDNISVVVGYSCEEIDATVVIDKEGTYGGYDALAPYIAIEND